MKSEVAGYIEVMQDIGVGLRIMDSRVSHVNFIKEIFAEKKYYHFLQKMNDYHYITKILEWLPMAH